jgi:tetratricopeptide (TPR) repeat protein
MATPLHEAAEALLTRGSRLHYPFMRWFHEGAANWVMFQALAEVAPELSPGVEEIADTSTISPAVRDQVNLLQWPLLRYVQSGVADTTPEIEQASYRCATAAMVRILAHAPPDSLAHVVREVKGRPATDNAQLLHVLTEVTGTDARDILLDYVPAEIRTGLAQNNLPALRTAAQDAADRGDYALASATYHEALALDPGSLDMRLNLAWCLRKSGHDSEDCENQLAYVLALLRSVRSHSFSPLAPDDADTCYLQGRLAYSVGDRHQALMEFRRAVQLDPGHADASEALELLRLAQAPVTVASH